MAKATEYRPAVPLDGAGIAEVDRRAREAPIPFRSELPQVVKLAVDGKKGWLPPIEDAPGFSLSPTFQLRCEFDPARMAPEVTAGIIAGLLGAKAGEEGLRHVEISYVFDFQEVEGGLRRGASYGSICAQVTEGEPWFEFTGSGYTMGDDRGEYHGEERASRIEVEREHMRKIIEAVAEVGRLPIRVVPILIPPRQRSFTVEHTSGGKLKTFFEPDEHGTTHFQVSLPDRSPDDLARLFHDVRAIIPASTPPRYAGMVYVGRGDLAVDPCREVYDHLLRQRWPVTSYHLDTDLSVRSAEGLEGLRKITTLQRRGFRLPLGQFTLDARRAARLSVLVKPDGHHLRFHLPTADESRLAEFERALGVVFAE